MNKRSNGCSDRAIPHVMKLPLRQQLQERSHTYSSLKPHVPFTKPLARDVAVDLLTKHLDTTLIQILVSASNASFNTHDGIDICGQRLGAEIQQAVRSNPKLQSISFLAHSMGGLIARYACGKLYDPATGTVASLTPLVFLTLATPHQGCATIPCEARIPLVDNLSKWSLVGKYLEEIALGKGPSISSKIFGRTGDQFFFSDADAARSREADGEPMIALISRDAADASDPDRRGYFFSALAAFQHRCLYSNIEGDHLVGLANASLRSAADLPKFTEDELQRSVGVVRAEGDDTGDWGGTRSDGSNPDPSVSGSPGEALKAVAAANFYPPELDSPNDSSLGAKAGTKAAVYPPTHWVTLIRWRLQHLPYRRVDVCFRGSKLPGMAHYHIQVKRKLTNGVGAAALGTAVEYIVQRLNGRPAAADTAETLA